MHSFQSSVSGHNFLRTPSCSVCFESYDGEKRLPKILQCAHTICEECLNHLETTSRANIRNQPLDRSQVSINCPTCRALTHVPRSYVRSNYQLLDVIETMRDELSHNISFMACIDCRGVYHEKDVNLCGMCSPITRESNPQEVLDKGILIERFAICSTCLLQKHIHLGHPHISLQPLRVEMQRIENLRRMNSIQDSLEKMQEVLFKELQRAKDMCSACDVQSDISRFQLAENSYEQKKTFDEFVAQLKTKSDHFKQLVDAAEKLNDGIRQWNSDSKSRPPRPPSPTAAPVGVNGDPFPQPNNYPLYYFEHMEVPQ